MKWYTITIIILVWIILGLLAGGLGMIFFHSQQITALTKQNDAVLADLSADLIERDKKIKYLTENPITITKIVTKDKIIMMDDTEKIKLIDTLQGEKILLLQKIDDLSAIISSDTIMIESLKTQLEKSNKALKSIKYPSWGFGLHAIEGLDAKLGIDTYGIIMVRKYFLNGKLFLDFGVGVKFYDTWGGALAIGIGFTI